MNKKLILTVVSIVAAVALVVMGIVLVLKNAGDCKISIESKTALQGDAISLPVSITGNRGLYYGKIVINYDADVLTFVSCANGDVFEECESNNLDGQLVLIVNQTGVQNTKIDGVMAVLNFDINENAPKGVHNISFEVNTDELGDNTAFVTVSDPETFVGFEYENGKVTVK